ncbi:hypothetical protein C8R46DRAFT_880504, partial [Mycena filopes]
VRTRESGLYLSVIGNPLTGVAPKKFVQIFFGEERLPIAEGWKRSKTPITAESLDPIQNTIFFFRTGQRARRARTSSSVQRSRFESSLR